MSAFTAAGLVALALSSASQSRAQQSSSQGKSQSLANPRSELIDNLPPQDWLGVTTRTERGHLLGNPEAEAQLIEFISYTCSHCADFAKQSDNTLDIAAVGPGFISIEVRPIIRNSIDLVVSLLVQCGDPARFKQRHRTFLYTQDQWWGEALKAPESQKQIWARQTPAARMNAAQALDLDDTMRSMGFSSSQVTACLRDEAAAQALLSNDKADRAEFTITATPTFALDGAKLDDVGDWPSLAYTLQERFRPKPQAQVIENGRVTTIER